MNRKLGLLLTILISVTLSACGTSKKDVPSSDTTSGNTVTERVQPSGPE